MIGQSDDKIGKVVSDFAPNIVAISVLFSNLLESAHNIAKVVKKVKKDTIVILGGNHISSAVADYQIGKLGKNSGLPDFIKDLENDHFDLAMTGEGEFSFLEIVNKIINKEDYSKVPGLVKKTEPKKYIINPSTRIHNLNLLPRPARHLVDMEAYFKIGAFHSAKSRSKK